MTAPAKPEALTKPVLVRLTPELYAAVEREACRHGRSMPEIIRLLVQAGLDREAAHRG